MNNFKSNQHWFFSKEQVFKHYGTDLKIEISYRRASAAFIQDVGIRLKMPQLTIATAISYFHRFFIRHQLKDHDRSVVATACLFLAGKVEETPRKIDDVIKVSYMVKNKKKDADKSAPLPSITPDEHADLKNKILQNEHLILTTIAFELAVDHPYKYLLEYMKSIQGSKTLCQVAWNFVNDSLRTSLCLHYPPDLISYAAVYLATRFLNYQLVTEGKKDWWEMLNIKFETLEDISKQILDLYETNPFNNSNNNSSSNSNSSTTDNNNTTTQSSSSSNKETVTNTDKDIPQPSNETGDINKTPNKSTSTTATTSSSSSSSSSANNTTPTPTITNLNPNSLNVSPNPSNNNNLNPSQKSTMSTTKNSNRFSPYKNSSSNSNENKRSPSPNKAPSTVPN